MHADDAFLQRLRDHADDPAAFAATPWPVADLFRSAPALIEAHVQTCEGDTGPRASYRTEKAKLSVTRGDRTSIERLFWKAKEQPGETEFEFNDLWDFYQTRAEPCPRGQSILLLTTGFEGPPIWSGTEEWVETNFPGWTASVRERLAETGEEDEIAPLEFILGDALPKAGQPRPLLIHDGRIRLADIPTGLTLTGPEWITVDQAFAWFEEGRAPTPAPSSW